MWLRRDVGGIEGTCGAKTGRVWLREDVCGQEGICVAEGVCVAKKVSVWLGENLGG